MKEKTKYEVKMGENEVSYQHEKLSKVGCGLFSFSRLYSWSGAIISIFGAFAALSIVIFKFVMDNMECYERFGHQNKTQELEVKYCLWGLCVSLLILSVAWLVLHVQITSRALRRDFAGIENLAKIGNYTFGCMEFLGIFVSFIFALVGVTISSYVPSASILILLAPDILALVFVIVKIDGIRKRKSGYVKAYLIYRCTVLCLLVVAVVATATMFDWRKTPGRLSDAVLLASAWVILVLVYNQDLGLTHILLAARQETAADKLKDTPAQDMKAIEYLNSVEELVSDPTDAHGNI